MMFIFFEIYSNFHIAVFPLSLTLAVCIYMFLIFKLKSIPLVLHLIKYLYDRDNDSYNVICIIIIL